jgi:hypothetical protein
MTLKVLVGSTLFLMLRLLCLRQHAQKIENILDFDSLDQHFDKLDQNVLHSTILIQKSFYISTLVIRIPCILLVSLHENWHPLIVGLGVATKGPYRLVAKLMCSVSQKLIFFTTRQPHRIKDFFCVN